MANCRKFDFGFALMDTSGVGALENANKQPA
jgi:hypothetical protein